MIDFFGVVIVFWEVYFLYIVFLVFFESIEIKFFFEIKLKIFLKWDINSFVFV